MDRSMYFGTGRRKCSIAKVTLFQGSGEITINGISGNLYLQYNSKYIQSSRAPLGSLGLENKYDVHASVIGGGLTGQMEALRLGVARALCALNQGNRSVLKREGFLTRISRNKERKKYGLRKARKAAQFSKR